MEISFKFLREDVIGRKGEQSNHRFFEMGKPLADISHMINAYFANPSHPELLIFMNDSELPGHIRRNIEITYEETTPSGIVYRELKPKNVIEKNLAENLQNWMVYTDLPIPTDLPRGGLLSCMTKVGYLSRR